MLKINVLTNKGLIQEIDILGHAGYADYGNDIVCAAASSIVTTTINATLTFGKDYITYNQKKDNFSIKIIKQNEITNNLFNNMINMLNELMDDYPNNIEIKEENS